MKKPIFISPMTKVICTGCNNQVHAETPKYGSVVKLICKTCKTDEFLKIEK